MKYIILSFLLLLSSLVYSQKYLATKTAVFPSVFSTEHVVINEFTSITVTPTAVMIVSSGDTLFLKIVAPLKRRVRGECYLQTFAAISGGSKFVVGYEYQGTNFLNLGLLDSSNRLLMFIVSPKIENL